MSRTSIIQNPADDHMVIIRQSYVDICKAAPDSVCAAAILNDLIYWFEVKLRNYEQHLEQMAAQKDIDVQYYDIWAFRSYKKLVNDIAFRGRNTIINCVQWLVNEGFVLQRSHPLNPRDNTNYYMVVIPAVQAALDGDEQARLAAVQDVKEADITDPLYLPTWLASLWVNRGLFTGKQGVFTGKQTIQRILREDKKGYTSYIRPPTNSDLDIQEDTNNTLTEVALPIVKVDTAASINPLPVPDPGKRTMPVIDTLLEANGSQPTTPIVKTKTVKTRRERQIDWIRGVMTQIGQPYAFNGGDDWKNPLYGRYVKEGAQLMVAADALQKKYPEIEISPQVLTEMWGGIDKNGWLFATKGLDKTLTSTAVLIRYFADYIYSPECGLFDQHATGVVVKRASQRTSAEKFADKVAAGEVIVHSAADDLAEYMRQKKLKNSKQE